MRERRVLLAVVATWLADREPVGVTDVAWLVEENDYHRITRFLEALADLDLVAWVVRPDASEGLEIGTARPTAKGLMEVLS